MRFTIGFWLKDQWELRNKVGSLNIGAPLRFKPGNFSVYCNALTHWPALPISTIRAVYVLPNLVALRSSFKLFPLSINFERTLSLWSSIISAYYCTVHYTTTSLSLWVLLWNRTISTLVSLFYIFNFSCPQISTN